MDQMIAVFENHLHCLDTECTSTDVGKFALEILPQRNQVEHFNNLGLFM
jgi:hypothetical protein